MVTFEGLALWPDVQFDSDPQLVYCYEREALTQLDPVSFTVLSDYLSGAFPALDSDLLTSLGFGEEHAAVILANVRSLLDPSRPLELPNSNSLPNNRPSCQESVPVPDSVVISAMGFKKTAKSSPVSLGVGWSDERLRDEVHRLLRQAAPLELADQDGDKSAVPDLYVARAASGFVLRCPDGSEVPFWLNAAARWRAVGSAMPRSPPAAVLCPDVSCGRGSVPRY